MRNLPTIANTAAPPIIAAPAAHQEEASGGGMTLHQLMAIAWAYRWQSAIIAAGLFVLSAGIIKLLPKTYTATAQLMMNYEVNDPLSGKEFPVGLLESYIATQIQIMQSPEVLGSVIDKLNLTKSQEFTAGFSGDPSKVREYVKETLEKSLSIQQGAYSSQLIYITASSRRPETSALLANTLAELYVSQQVQRLNDPASARATRYASQLNELKEKVNAAQERVTEYRQKSGLPELGTSNAADNDSLLLSSLEQKLQDAQNVRRAIESKQDTNQAVSAQALGSTVVMNLKNQLATLEAQLAQARTTLGEQHPKVIELRTQIEATRQSLNKEYGTYSASSSSDLTSARELESKLSAAVAQQREKVLNVRQRQDDGSKLLLELQSAQAVYKRALDGYDQILAAATGGYSNVNLASRAIVPLKAEKPKVIKLLLMAFAAALAIGLAGPLVYELMLNRRVRCRDDVERDLGVPVLAEFTFASSAGGATQ